MKGEFKMNIQSEVGSFLFTVRDLTNDLVIEALVTELREKNMDVKDINDVITGVKSSINTVFSRSADVVTKMF